MENWHRILLLILVAAASLEAARIKKKSKSMPLGEQLSKLEACGIRLSAGFTAEDLLKEWGTRHFMSKPYVLAMIAMGNEAKLNGQFHFLSDQVWHLDTECIEDHGAYANIARRLRDMGQEDLKLEKIKDYVNIEEGKAWLEFDWQGKAYHWDAKVDDDWVDPTILSRFAELLAESSSGRRFTYFSEGGQDCLIGIATPEQLKALNRLGLKIVWLR